MENTFNRLFNSNASSLSLNLHGFDTVFCSVDVVGFYDTFQYLRSSASLPTERESPTNFAQRL